MTEKVSAFSRSRTRPPDQQASALSKELPTILRVWRINWLGNCLIRVRLFKTNDVVITETLKFRMYYMYTQKCFHFWPEKCYQLL